MTTADEGIAAGHAGDAKFPSALQHVRAVATAPAVFGIVIPALVLLYVTDDQPLFAGTSRHKGPWWLLPAGICYMIFGFTLLLAANISFHTQGRGTLVPWDAPKRLVVQGLFQYTRNPMYWGVFSLILGEALVFNSRHLLYYLLLAVALQMVHVPLNEERWLRRGFGAEYEEYCRHVPRWLPRMHPYRPQNAPKHD